jgi:5-methylcytosine-specific restriction protein A
MKKISKYSWTIYPSKNILIKKMDKSTFLHHGTGIPKEFKKYFDIEGLEVGEKKDIKIKYFNEIIDAHFEIINLDRARLMWGKELKEIISSRFPMLYNYFKNDNR